MVSFVNPHDITLYGFWTRLVAANPNTTPAFSFDIEPVVPTNLFTPQAQLSEQELLITKPSCQASYRDSYRQWIQPIHDIGTYQRFYYQLHKNVDEQMYGVYQALMNSRFRDNPIVIFTSDHGDLLNAHGGMHQKWYQAYDEAIRVSFIVSNPVMTALRALVGVDHSDALPLVGRDLSAVVTGASPQTALTDPVYFMTDDDPSRGLDQDNWTGIAYDSVTQPSHIETVVAMLNGEVWKYSRCFDNPQFWTTPNDPNDPNADPQAEDVVLMPTVPLPPRDKPGSSQVLYTRTVKMTPAQPEEFEMFNVTQDPVELANLYGHAQFAAQQQALAQMLAQQHAQKRLHPVSGSIPGQPA